MHMLLSKMVNELSQRAGLDAACPALVHFEGARGCTEGVMATPDLSLLTFLATYVLTHMHAYAWALQ